MDDPTTMLRRLFTLLAPVLMLALAAVGGWYLTQSFDRTSDAGSDFDRCWSQAGSAKQIDCVADRLEQGARRAIAGATGAQRNDRLIAYVRATETAARQDERLGGSCHPALHQLGRSEGELAARAGAAPAFPPASSQLCTAGYVHGLSEGYLTGTPNADVATVFPKLCSSTNAREGCAHGIGHALLRARTKQPAPAATDGAAQACKGLPGTFPINCANGVYMELAMRRQPTPVTPASYVGACRSSDDVDRYLPCWGYLTLNLTTNDVPIEDVPAWCARADLPGQFPCIEQYGRALGVKGVDECASVSDPKELRQRCVDGAIGLQVGSGQVSKAEALRSCDAVTSKSLRAYCSRAVSRYTEGRRSVEQG